MIHISTYWYILMVILVRIEKIGTYSGRKPVWQTRVCIGMYWYVFWYILAKYIPIRTKIRARLPHGFSARPCTYWYVPGMYWYIFGYILVHTDHTYVPICTNMSRSYWHVFWSVFGKYWYVFGIYRPNMFAHIGTFVYILVGQYWYVLVCIDTYRYV